MNHFRLALLLAGALVLAAAGGCAVPGSQGQAASEGNVVPTAPVDTDARRRSNIRLELAANYYRQRIYHAALEELREAIKADPTYPEAFGMLGLVYMDLDDRPKAEESFRRALELAPRDAEINNNYGWYLCQTGRERESLAYFDRALADRLYQTPVRPLHNAGVCMRRIGDLAKARAYLERAFQIDAGNPVAMFNLAEIALEQNELERAHFYAQRLLNSYDPNAQTLWLGLRVQHARGDRDGEASLGAQLRRRFPTSIEARKLAEGRYSE